MLPSPTLLPCLTRQRRQWLQEAMSAAFRGQQEEVEQMKNCLRVLSQPAPPLAAEADLAADQQEREGALELLADLCENMDNAAGTPRPTCGCALLSLCLFPHLSPTSCCGSALVLSLGDHTISLFPTLPPPASTCLVWLQLRSQLRLPCLPAWSPCHREGTFSHPTHLIAGLPP